MPKAQYSTPAGSRLGEALNRHSNRTLCHSGFGFAGWPEDCAEVSSSWLNSATSFVKVSWSLS
jgi:hypothetical protein